MLLEAFQPLTSILGVDHLHPALLQRRGQREHVADFVVDHEDLASVERRIAAA